MIATNLLGQNTPAIAATEAHYLEMWAQDAAAMYGYAASSASASQLTPFNEPPKTTNDTATQGEAVAQSSTNTASHLSQLMQPAVHSLAQTNPTTSTPVGLPPVPSQLTDWNNIWSTFTGPYFLQGPSTIPGGPFLSFGQAYAWGQNGQGAAAYLVGPKMISGALSPLTHGPTAVKPMLSSAVAPMSGSMGKAALVGSMSVPQGWTEAAPAIRTLAQVFPSNPGGRPGGLIGRRGRRLQPDGAVEPGRTRRRRHRSPLGERCHSAGSLGGIVAEADAAAATIIVIPVLEG